MLTRNYVPQSATVFWKRKSVRASVILALTEAGLRDGLKRIVVGASVNQRYAEEIGADA